MIYSIVCCGASPLDLDLPLEWDNPYDAELAFRKLRELYPDVDFTLLKNGQPPSESELAADIESRVTQLTRTDELHLSHTHRPGRGGDADIALGADGQRHGVWRPANPDDRFGDD